MYIADIVIVGPQSAGSRALRRVCEDSGLVVEVDFSHGTDPEWPERWTSTKCCKLVITREELPLIASQRAVWFDEPEYRSYVDSMIGILDKVGREWLHITYEEMCADVDATIEKIADFVRIRPWKYTGPELVDQNSKWVDLIPDIEPTVALETNRIPDTKKK